MEPAVEIRALGRDDLSRVGEIDRRERIRTLFEQRGTELVPRAGDFDSPPWETDGRGEHSVHAQHAALGHYVDEGGIALGAFAGERLVGIGVVVPHIRPTVAQLAYLHVSRDHRATGVGTRLVSELDAIARRAGDTHMVVSATPSENTVRFYLGRGFRPMAEPLPELVAIEPDDIHLGKAL